jgi:hypothetical protein
LLEVSELKVKTESLRQANDALELEIQPRRITEEKRQAIIEAFRHLHFAEKTDKIKITSEGYDQESGVFAQQIAEALAGAGISVQLDKNSTSERQLDFGVKYQFKYPPNPAVIAIAKSLKKADIIPAELNTNWSLGDFIMEIWVGAKPLPEVKNSN